MKNSNYNSSLDVYLDLDVGSILRPADQIGTEFLAKFLINKEQIGRRYGKLLGPTILYQSRSVRLYIQARDLYCLGLFESTIMVCRSTAEYIASEIFEESIQITDETQKNFILDSIDFRKVVNDYLFRQNIIDKTSKELFNELYDIGNNYIHPKTKELNIEKDAEEALNKLKDLIDSLKNVLNDYSIIDGRLVPKK